MDVWAAVGALGTLAAAGVAAWAARQSRVSAQEANAAAGTMAQIERDRQHSELTPRLRVSCEPWGPGSDDRRLRVMLVGPPGLDRLDTLLVTVRDDQFQRGEGTLLAGGPTREEIKQQVWGPYRFRPGTGPGEARADSAGRATECGLLPAGEELVFLLEPTMPPHWATGTSAPDWQRARGTVIRIVFAAQHTAFGSWALHCELDTRGGNERVTVKVPQE